MLAENSEGRGCRNSAEIVSERAIVISLMYVEHIQPLIHWKEKKLSWPCLADLTCKYLSIPPSYAASECLFSSAADVWYSAKAT